MAAEQLAATASFWFNFAWNKPDAIPFLKCAFHPGFLELSVGGEGYETDALAAVPTHGSCNAVSHTPRHSHLGHLETHGECTKTEPRRS